MRNRYACRAAVALVACVVAPAFLIAVPTDSAEARKGRKLGDRTLRIGHRGADVKALQRLLSRAGFRAKADGVFGGSTRRSVLRFEREMGLRPDGRVTRLDARRLKVAVSASTSGGYQAAPPPASEAERTARSEPPPAGSKARLTKDGLAVAPAGAPPAVKRVIAAANRIAHKPYRYGGGHGRWEDSGYDCSGSVSYALHGGGLLKRSMPSGSFTSYGQRGAGRWITLYTNSGHIYMVVAGLRFDTSGRAKSGSRWQSAMRSPRGYTVRHPKGL